MNILVTNDDGIRAEGISALVESLKVHHKIFVVAPESDRSGVSCQITVGVPLEFREEKIWSGVKSFSICGTPVDCVLSALNGGYLGEKIDAVISGINHGANLGTDVVYSGTCGAARYASLFGLPSVALSVDSDSRDDDDRSGEFYFENLAEFALKNLDVLLELCGNSVKLDENRLTKMQFVNVNAPAVKKYRGAKISVPSNRRYVEKISLSESCGKKFSTCGGENRAFSFGAENSDGFAVKNGFVSVCAVKSEPTMAILQKNDYSFVV